MAEEGEVAPDFKLLDASGESISLKDFKGKKVVLYFYPKDDTPGCTMEAIDFTRLKEEFGKAGAVVLGVSSDSCESHVKFTKKRNLGITLLSDENAEVQRSYGVWRKKSFMGKEYMGTARVTVLIGKNGRIVKIWDPVTVPKHADAVLDIVKKI